MTKDRFDLEQEIMECWNVTRDLQNFYNCEVLTEDEQQNYLLGLIAIYEVKFNKLWDTFETLVRDRQI
jgi:hypothetical protein